MMDSSEKLFNILFEISNEDRYNILTELLAGKANLSKLSQILELNLSETSRHLSRLMGVNLIVRNPDGSYNLTHNGAQILHQVDNIRFFSEYDNYFKKHTVRDIPIDFQGRFNSLIEGELIESVVGFILRIEQVIKDAKSEVWLLVDQFPLHHLSIIMDALERGVKFKIIEPQNRAIHSDLKALAPVESHTLERMKIASHVDQKTLKNNNLFMIVSENEAVVGFPTLGGEIDYKGFKFSDIKAHSWCRDLFHRFWENASFSEHDLIESKDTLVNNDNIPTGKVVNGRERPEYDVQVLQDAVDRYPEVVLRGRFDLGNSSIIIKRSVIIRGDGRTNDVPDTKIYKKGWNFPFVDGEFLILIRGENIDVTIENVHIENFNGTCIGTVSGNSLVLRDNRITLHSGWGRGLSFGRLGDHVVGIVCGETFQEGGFPSGILIENNYLDFALSYESGGFLSLDGRELQPEFRPDLVNHEVPVCVGIKVSSNMGKVTVKNNTVRNMNARGIVVCDNRDSAEISVYDNIITSDVFGAYPYNRTMAGVGIFIQSSWSEPVKGSKVNVINNKISCTKKNYCGIAVHGPSMYQTGVGKLEKCVVRDNVIELQDGYVGLQIRKTDSTIVEKNMFRGIAYYGIQILGSDRRGDIDLTASENIIRRNDMDGLEIKDADEYSDANIRKNTFSGTENKSKTAHIWLNHLTNGNQVKLHGACTVIDEGKNNLIK